MVESIFKKYNSSLETFKSMAWDEVKTILESYLKNGLKYNITSFPILYRLLEDFTDEFIITNKLFSTNTFFCHFSDKFICESNGYKIKYFRETRVETKLKVYFNRYLENKYIKNGKMEKNDRRTYKVLF